MLARKCDRCGKLYEHYLGVSKFKQDRKANGIIFIDGDTDNRYWSRDTLDFCPECMSELTKWLKGGVTHGS